MRYLEGFFELEASRAKADEARTERRQRSVLKVHEHAEHRTRLIRRAQQLL